MKLLLSNDIHVFLFVDERTNKLYRYDVNRQAMVLVPMEAK